MFSVTAASMSTEEAMVDMLLATAELAVAHANQGELDDYFVDLAQIENILNALEKEYERQ